MKVDVHVNVTVFEKHCSVAVKTTSKFRPRIFSYFLAAVFVLVDCLYIWTDVHYLWTANPVWFLLSGLNIGNVFFYVCMIVVLIVVARHFPSYCFSLQLVRV